VDHHRALRKGFPEVVFGEGKTPEQIAAIAEELVRGSGRALGTRGSGEAFAAVQRRVPEAHYHETARVIEVRQRGRAETAVSGVVVAAAGTADLPVAEEAAVTARALGCEVGCLYDVGIAGLHRLLEHLETLRRARVIVAVAGMEGALPSLVAGLVAAPVIAVPTSVGYGTSYGGLTALLAMLNSCSPGVAVVNIDNGFGAGYLAALIARAGS